VEHKDAGDEQEGHQQHGNGSNLNSGRIVCVNEGAP